MTALLAGNSVDLLECGASYFPALRQAIAQAKHEVHIETYIFEADSTGLAIAEALMSAAERGVVVNVLMDGFGAAEFPSSLWAELSAAGVRLLHYRPGLGIYRLRWHRLRRLHRKIAVIDAEVAFVGGINIIDDRNAPEDMPHRFDFAVRVTGPLVQAIHALVLRMWRRTAWTQLRRAWLHDNPWSSACRATGKVPMKLVVRDNLRHRRDIEWAYLQAIRQAKHEIILANAYFVPGVTLRRALVKAARRGVHIVLLLQGRVEHWLAYHAARALYHELLSAGIEIHEYHRSYLHAKVAVIDDQWATVGSSNIDPFSLLLAHEANVVIIDPVFNRTLRTSLQLAMQNGSRRLLLEDWQRPRPLGRMMSWLAYGLVRFATEMLGYGREEYSK